MTDPSNVLGEVIPVSNVPAGDTSSSCGAADDLRDLEGGPLTESAPLSTSSVRHFVGVRELLLEFAMIAAVWGGIK